MGNSFFRVFFLLIFLQLSDLSYSQQVNDVSQSVRSIKYYSHIEIPADRNGQVMPMDETIYMHFHADQTLFQIPVFHMNVKMGQDRGDIELTDSVGSYNYFLLKNEGSRQGKLYIAPDRTKTQEVSADAVLKGKFPPENIIISANDSLANIHPQDDGMIEVYVPRLKKGDSYPDVTRLYFSKSLQQIPFSFSKRLDDSSKMKLHKIEMIYNETGVKNTDSYLPARRYVFSIEKTTLNDKDLRLVQSLFER